jgi:hypothetical protein
VVAPGYVTIGGAVAATFELGVGLGVALAEGSFAPAGGAVVKADEAGAAFLCQASCHVAGFQLEVFQLVEFHVPLDWQPERPATSNTTTIHRTLEETRMTCMSL